MSRKKPDKTELDLISLVQRARMMHDAEATPSNIPAVYWIEAHCKDCTPPTPRSGQWVLSTTVEEVDALWEKIKSATEAGQLGYKSKVSTASHRDQHRSERLICARAYDSDDQDDVQRIRAALNALGIEGDWQYERDNDG